MTQDAVSEMSDQQEQLIQIGAHLQEARHQKGLSLDEVASKTLIQARLLRAIESGDLSALPEPVYIRGFVKRYADYLGLNGTEVASAFPLNTDSQPLPSGWNASAAAQLRPLHLYAAYVALIVIAISGVSYLLSTITPSTVSQQSSGVSETAEDASPEPATPEVSDTAEPEDASGPDAALAADEAGETPPTAQSDAPVQVSLELVERSWLRVIVDGTEEFEGVLQEGETQDWTAENTVTVRAGNAGGVVLAVNGQPPAAMGEPGSVSEQTFSPEAETDQN